MDINKLKFEADKNENTMLLKEKEKRLHKEYKALFTTEQYRHLLLDFRSKLIKEFSDYFKSVGYNVTHAENGIYAQYKNSIIELIYNNTDTLELKISNKPYSFPIEIHESSSTYVKPLFHGILHDNKIMYGGNYYQKEFDIEFLEQEIKHIETAIQEMKTKISSNKFEFVFTVYEKMNIPGEFMNIVDLIKILPD